jgi:hypothetical protein
MNEAQGMAAVHCVIIGFAAFDIPNKRLFDYDTVTSDPREVNAANISPYLVDSGDILITNRARPICDVPDLVFGNMPTDGGNLLLTDEERQDLLEQEPRAARFVRPFISAREFISGLNRWCLWLPNATPAEINEMPAIRARVQAVRAYRLRSNRATTRDLADTPYLFGEIRQPTQNYVLVPRHSSESRRYVPIAFFDPGSIVADSCCAVPNGTLYHFGILTSQMHMGWMRQVCGRIKSDYRYSTKLVYNNFPFPGDVSQQLRNRVTVAAQGVLDARLEFPDESLANLYNINTMPANLVQAHRNLDRAVDRCYRGRAFNSELDRLEFLFERYRQLVQPLNA